MITDGEKWHDTALKSEQTEDGLIRPTKSLSRLFKGITSNHKGDFYCLNCLHSFRSYNILKKHDKLFENNDYCYIEMLTEKNNILKYSEGTKSVKMPYVIYADLKCLLLKKQSCQNNLDKSYTERKAIHEPCGYSLDLVSSFSVKENKHSFYRGKDCDKKFFKELKEICTRIVDYEQKEMASSTDRKKKLWRAKKCYICQKRFYYNKNEKKIYKLYRKVRDHYHFTGKFRGAAHGICNLRYRVPHEIPVKFHNGSSYDYHHIIKELAEEFKEGYFECLAENSENILAFQYQLKNNVLMIPMK